MCCCDDYGPSCYRETTRKARKAHRCQECCREIGIGERHLEITGVWDGRPLRMRICEHCQATVAAIKRADPEACWCIGELRDAVHEYRWDWLSGSKALGRIFVGLKRKWTVRRGNRKGQLMAVPSVAAKNEAATAGA